MILLFQTRSSFFRGHLGSNFMTNEEQKKRKKRQKQLVILKEGETESEEFVRLVTTLEDLEKEEKHVDLQVCPKCKSARVRRVGAISGDMSGHMGITPLKFECACGWRGRLILKATNRKMGPKEVAIMAEADNSS